MLGPVCGVVNVAAFLWVPTISRPFVCPEGDDFFRNRVLGIHYTMLQVIMVTKMYIAKCFGPQPMAYFGFP